MMTGKLYFIYDTRKELYHAIVCFILKRSI
jgi:hypothetical protein